MSQIQAYLDGSLGRIDDFELIKKENHQGVILGFLNNHRSNPKNIDQYMFILGDLKVINPKNLSNYRLIPTELIENYTEYRSNDLSDSQLVIFIPTTYKFYKPGSHRKILQYILKNFQTICYLNQIDQVFVDLLKLEENFREEHFFNRLEDIKQMDQMMLIGRRIKNQMCVDDCEDENLISQIDDSEFKKNYLHPEYNWVNLLEPLDKIYERKTTFQEWKEFIGRMIEPLAIENYQKILTYQETEKLFQLVFKYDPSYFTQLYGIFLSSYYLCQLVIKNQADWMMMEFIKRSTPEDQASIFSKMFKILYYEERLLSGNITTNHRSVLSLNFCSLLGNLPSKTYIPFDIDHEVVNFNFPAKIIDGVSRIRQDEDFISCFQQVSGGVLEGLDWKGLNVFFTGATAELCYYHNSIFPFPYLISNSVNNPYLGSDIDLGVWINPQELGIEPDEDLSKHQKIKDELRRRAEIILQVVVINTGFKDLDLTARNNRWIIADPRLPREIDIFSFVQDPAALIYNYHMATCRVIAQFNQPAEIQMLTSTCLSASLGTCIDRRWFTSKTSIHSRIMKQFKRGIGLMMNPNETKVMIQYIKIYRENSDSNPIDILYHLDHHGYYNNILRRYIGISLFANKDEIYGRFRSEL